MCDQQKKLISSITFNINGDHFKLVTDAPCEAIWDLKDNLIKPALRVLGYSETLIDAHFGEV